MAHASVNRTNSRTAGARTGSKGPVTAAPTSGNAPKVIAAYRFMPSGPCRFSRKGESPYRPSQPPSTGRTEPWIKSPAAEESRTMAPLRSSGSP